MVRFGVADYGMNVWEGGCFSLEDRLRRLKAIGYDGIEWLKGIDFHDAFENAVVFHRLGMDFSSCNLDKPEETFKCACAFGKSYVWMPSKGRDIEMKDYIRHCRNFTAAAASYNLKAALHNHMGCRIESPEELDMFMNEIPEASLLLDVGHLAAVGGDCVAVTERYFDRLSAIHLKGVEVTDASAPMDTWWKRFRLCGIAEDALGIDFAGIIEVLARRGYDGWILVEHDTHLRDPYVDLKNNIDVARKYWQEFNK
ncbi:MAG: sugar phosphate isomerase/epimerase [Victivallaceae bacterium]|nr:sugar phosphate isomerase/epimerase [Victivallaceae bacterium]